jgi:N-acetylglucosaminyldiphosphoundecaprenol N-acetyl-beta-D-mannosaminyltransferase
MNILGIRIDNYTKKEISSQIEFFLSERKFHQIATVNPEFIIEAGKNEEFKNIINDCDLNVADGIGIKLAFWRYGQKLKCRMAGADLIWKIIRLANRNKLTIFLAANKNGLSSWEETRDAIGYLYPDLVIDGENIDPKDKNYHILNPNNDILFCNFGAPSQEIFIKSQKNDSIRLAMGVGGSFDFLTKKVRRAPYFWRFLGLEWLWRLILQPKRWRRIWRAVVIFPIKIILSKQ